MNSDSKRPDFGGAKIKKPSTRPSKPSSSTHGDEHEGATEQQVGKTAPPIGPAFKDEPKQG